MNQEMLMVVTVQHKNEIKRFSQKGTVLYYVDGVALTYGLIKLNNKVLLSLVAVNPKKIFNYKKLICRL